jgi:hypothetical protein
MLSGSVSVHMWAKHLSNPLKAPFVHSSRIFAPFGRRLLARWDVSEARAANGLKRPDLMVISMAHKLANNITGSLPQEPPDALAPKRLSVR